jgi:hypothetical protein
MWVFVFRVVSLLRIKSSQGKPSLLNRSADASLTSGGTKHGTHCIYVCNRVPRATAATANLIQRQAKARFKDGERTAAHAFSISIALLPRWEVSCPWQQASRGPICRRLVDRGHATDVRVASGQDLTLPRLYTWEHGETRTWTSLISTEYRKQSSD